MPPSRTPRKDVKTLARQCQRAQAIADRSPGINADGVGAAEYYVNNSTAPAKKKKKPATPKNGKR